MNSDELADLRRRLDQVDRSILDAVAARQELVQAIGRSKLQQGSGTRDFARERQVIESARNNATELGVEPGLAEGLMKLLIEGSLSRQESDRVQATAAGAHKSALIIGGAGLMGQWFARFLQSQDFEVLIADTAGAVEGFKAVEDWASEAEAADLVVIATPIRASAAILEQLAELKPSGVVFDIASLKSPLRAPLRALADAGCRVCSVHPMFGPDTRLLSGRHVVFVDLGHAEATETARALFGNTMARQVDMSLEDHDRLMAYILGLSHILNIAFFTALRESGEAAQRLEELSSTTFDAQLEIAWRVAGENPGLYFEIQSLNDYRHAPLNALSAALERLRRMIDNDDAAGFTRLMEQGLDYLNRHRRPQG